MSRIVLENLCNDLPSNIPEIYKHLDTKTFGSLKLFDHQEKALKNVLNALFYYFNEKEKLIHFYKTFDYAQYEELYIDSSSPNFLFLSNYFDTSEEKIVFKQILNRASFWMATGSGKTLVIIKLMELLFHLVKNDQIPYRDILFLAPKPGIIKQIKEHVEKFNKNGSLRIVLNDLRERAQVQF